MVKCAIIAKICTYLTGMRHNKHVLHLIRYQRIQRQHWPRCLRPSMLCLSHLALLSSLWQSNIANQLELVEGTSRKVLVGRNIGDLTVCSLTLEE